MVWTPKDTLALIIIGTIFIAWVILMLLFYYLMTREEKIRKWFKRWNKKHVKDCYDKKCGCGLQ